MLRKVVYIYNTHMCPKKLVTLIQIRDCNHYIYV